MKNINEVAVKNYVTFYSMNDLVTTMRHLAKVWSWGAEDFTNDQDIFLRFKVTGHLFKGWVHIGVNGKDLFDIFFTNEAGDIEDQLNDIYLEDLIDTIDEKVEKIPGYKW